METRLDYKRAAPSAVEAILGLRSYVANCGLER